ncbi:NifB/NifX family molybdenum-iron cluster-binding protein [uncultured Draconibacterium sp.]|uniref:NifB/NifX family molybdenum-iron cluster-binding protein n=1 Tax=uncultured Draconibacterium sp. TaxID=1573823 RepID=UPI0032175E1A
MSKVYAITSTGKTEKSFLDLRFGKCEFVVLFDVEKNQYSIEENPFIGENHSGVKLVEFLKERGVNTIITGEVGPMVSALLEKEKLQLVLLAEERIKVEEVMDRIGI